MTTFIIATSIMVVACAAASYADEIDAWLKRRHSRRISPAATE